MFRRREEPQAYSPYERFVVEEMILRDHLAVDRTSLANERTFLSYARTSLAVVISGVSMIEFLDGLVTEVLGVGFILAGIATAVFGLRRFRWYRRRIARVTASSALPPRPVPDD